MAKALQIIHVSDKARAETFRDAGFEPVECSFGVSGSVVGSLTMDHHGELSHLEGVAVRAYLDHFGARRDDPRFVVTGAADADMTFAIAALSGILPHPSRDTEFATAPPPVRASMTRDLFTLAAVINQVDVAPIGVRLEETEEGTTLLLWNQLASSVQDAMSVYSGVDRWRTLLTARPLKSLLEATKREEADRVTLARQAKAERVSDQVILVESAAWGFDVWYAEHAPVVVALTPHANVTVGCPDVKTAERLFGAGGLKNVFGHLEPAGWGGRESIGGSPRGAKLTREQALAATRVIAGLVIQK